MSVAARRHSWALPHALATIESAGRGVAVLLNVGQTQALLGLAQPQPAEPARTAMDLRTYGVGAQILRDLGVRRMKLMSNRRRMPSMVGYGLGSHRLPLRAPGLSAKTPTRQHADTHHGVIAMQGADRANPPRLDGSDLRVAIVQARFNAELTDRLAQAASPSCSAWASRRATSATSSVPGALEVPVALQALAEADEHDALIALGCIIRGETYHFELVANESGAGVTRVSLDHGVPIANAILTVENEAQAWARAEERADAARVAVEWRICWKNCLEPESENRPQSATQAAAGTPRPKSARRRSLRAGAAGLYEWLISRADVGVVMAHMRESRTSTAAATAPISTRCCRAASASGRGWTA